MDGAHAKSRPRDSRAQSPVESSSDELAAGSDHEEAERRRTSWNTQKNFTPQRPNPRERHYNGSESPDELAVDAEEYWRSSRKRRRSPSPIDRREDMRSQDARSQHDSDTLSNERRSLADRDHASYDGTSVRSATPVPVAAPPPTLPPKPERLNYKEKFVLRGHLRGLSAVQFSPDSSMIASAGTFWSGALEMRC